MPEDHPSADLAVLEPVLRIARLLGRREAAALQRAAANDNEPPTPDHEREGAQP